MKAFNNLFLLISVLLLVVLHLSATYRVLSNSDPNFECSPCARTRMIGCFNGKCTYRCYRSCTNGTYSYIGMTSLLLSCLLISWFCWSEAHRFIIMGTKWNKSFNWLHEWTPECSNFSKLIYYYLGHYFYPTLKFIFKHNSM